MKCLGNNTILFGGIIMGKMIAIFAMLFVCCGAYGEEIVQQVNNPWTPVLGELVLIILQIVSPVIILLVSWAIWKVASKFGIEKDAIIDDIIRKYVQEGINWAEVWAKTQAQKPTSEQKYAEAVKHIVGLIKSSGIPGISAERLKILIETQLASYKNDKTNVING